MIVLIKIKDKMETTKYMFTVNQADQVLSVKVFLQDNGVKTNRCIELDAGSSVLFMVTCSKDIINTLSNEYKITLYNGNMQLKQII